MYLCRRHQATEMGEQLVVTGSVALAAPTFPQGSFHDCVLWQICQLQTRQGSRQDSVLWHLPDRLEAVAATGPVPFSSVEPSVIRASTAGRNAFISKLGCVCVCVCVWLVLICTDNFYTKLILL